GRRDRDRDREQGRGAPRDGGDGAGGGTWFRVSIGRNNNADPKWLLPMLCKRGGVTRQDIGVIRIFERETKVEISDEAAQRFARAVRGTESGGIRIEPVGAPHRGAHKPARGRDKPGRPARPA
ncbi:MAG: ATP-dependent helicase DeaD, partial [Frankiaceae bacterium]|nr:ATP-dependent helicase DeaD [Frankiaceae bacterium]